MTPEQLREAIDGYKYALRTAEGGDGDGKPVANEKYLAALRRRLAELEAEYQLRYGLNTEGNQ